MALDLKNLDETTRKLMAQEIKADIANGSIYHSVYLRERGIKEWGDLLLEAAQKHDSVWLAQQLIEEKRAFKVKTFTDALGRKSRKKFSPMNLADSEFNRYYIRAVCLRAIDENAKVVTYRAKPALRPQSPVGVEYDPRVLLDDLRNQKQTQGVPSNPNSGISVRLS
jgi:hypothetical protein